MNNESTIPTISVVIPLYNKADHRMDMIIQYADPMVYLIHQKSSGISAVRNPFVNMFLLFAHKLVSLLRNKKIA